VGRLVIRVGYGGGILILKEKDYLPMNLPIILSKYIILSMIMMIVTSDSYFDNGSVWADCSIKLAVDLRHQSNKNFICPLID